VKVFILGISGAIGALLADKLTAGGTEVHGLVRKPAQQVDLAARGAETTLGELSTMSAAEPGRRVPAGRPNIRAGDRLISLTASVGESRPWPTK